MRIKKILLLAVALLVMATVFFPWVKIESRALVVSGLHAAGTTYGKPGLLSLFCAGLIFLFALVPRIWAHRICVLFGAFNTGWALRNFIILSVCQGGECPQRQAAFYIYLLASIFLLIAVLIQDVPMRNTTPTPE